MKRVFCVCLVLALALVSCAAFAEGIIAPQQERYVLIARHEADGTYSYALVGAGDGSDAMTVLGGETGSAQQRMAAFEQIASMLQPAVEVEGGEDALAFARGANGGITVSIGTQTLVALEGDSAFAIVTGSLAAVSIQDGCNVRIWDESGARDYGATGATTTTGSTASICKHCGKVDDGSAKHHTVISEFCKQGHTKCMGDPQHYCDPADGGCGEYYTCSHSNSHTRCIKCGKLWCYKEHGDHKELACGHRGCEVYGEEEKHEKCSACGGYLCDGANHTLAACGKHHAGASGDHSAATCGIDGHFTCDGKDHAAATCGIAGHYTCDGKDHAAATCGIAGHYTCDGKDHAAATCGIAGHYTCDGKDHAAATCGIAGHYTCDGKDHAAATCGIEGHYTCDGKDHAAASCQMLGHFTCDGMDHAPASCGIEGHYNCDGLDHSQCTG